MAYTVNINSVNRTALVLARTLKISPAADNRSACSFVLKTTAATFMPRAGMPVQVVDGAETVFGGIITNAPQEKVGVASGDTTAIRVNISANGYYVIPYRRGADTTYTSKTAGYVVADMITEYLTTDNITSGTINAGITFDAYSAAGKTVGSVLDEMASASGFKWYIDNSKALHFVAEDAVVDAAHDIEEGGLFTDFRNVKVEESLELYRNRQTIRGGVVSADGSKLLYTKEDATEITARQAIEGGSGIYENVYSDSNIVSLLVAEDVADNLLKKHGRVPIHIEFESFETDWRAGTKLKVNLPSHGISTDTYFLVEKVEIQDIGGNTLVSSIAATSKNDADFSTHRSEDYVDYFSKIIDGQTKFLKQAEDYVDLIANGQYVGGTFIDENAIYSPIIGGADGVFTGVVKVGTAGAIEIDGPQKKISIDVNNYIDETGIHVEAANISGQITAESLVLGNFDNLIEEADFMSDGVGWSYNDLYSTINTERPYIGTKSLKLQQHATPGTLFSVYTAKKYVTAPGEKFYMEAYNHRGGGGSIFSVALRVRVTRSNGTTTVINGTTSTSQWSWDKISEVFTMPADAHYVELGFLCGNGADASIFVDAVYARRMFTGTLDAVTGTFRDLMAGTSGGARLEMGESAGAPFLDMYDGDDELRVELLQDQLNFRDEDGDMSGWLLGKIYDTGIPGFHLRAPQVVLIQTGPWALDEETFRVASVTTSVFDGANDPYVDIVALDYTDTVPWMDSRIKVSRDIELQSDGDIDIKAEGNVISTTVRDNTTADSANMRISTTTGTFFRSTSAKKYKKDIEPLEMQYAEDFLLKCTPVWFRSLCKEDNQEHSFYGYVADEVMPHEPRLVDIVNGKADGFKYDRVAALLHVIVKDHHKRIEVLERRVSK